MNWTYHKIDPTSEQQHCPWDSARTLSESHPWFFSLLFPLFLSFYFPFRSFPFYVPFFVLLWRVYVYAIDIFLVWFGCKWYEIVTYSSRVPFNCVQVLLCCTCFGFYHRAAFCSLFVTTGPIPRKGANMWTLSSCHDRTGWFGVKYEFWTELIFSGPFYFLIRKLKKNESRKKNNSVHNHFNIL